MVASKEIIYLDANTLAGYGIQLGGLVLRHFDRLKRRGITEEHAHRLSDGGGELQGAIADHLEAVGATKSQSVETQQRRAACNEWMTTIKDGTRIALKRDKKKYAIVKHDLRIGVAYQTRRVSSVLAEAVAVQAGVMKHRALLKGTLTDEELDMGPAVIAALSQVAFGRAGALSEQLAKKFERSALSDRVLSLAKDVLDAVDLEFRAKEDEDVRDLFFGLDERMGSRARGGSNEPPTPPPAPAPAG